MDSMGEGEGGMIWENSTETCIISRVKQVSSPGWMHEKSARVWCNGMTQRDGMGREGGSGWGTHVNPWLIHVHVWQKPLQYCKVISLQLIKINEKKKEYWSGLQFPTLGNLPWPRVEHASPVSPAWVSRFSTTEPPGKPTNVYISTWTLRCDDIRSGKSPYKFPKCSLGGQDCHHGKSQR